MISREKKEKIVKKLEKAKILKVLIPAVGIIIANLQLIKLAKVTNNIISFIVFDVIISLVIIYLCMIVYKQSKKLEVVDEEKSQLNERAVSLMELNDSVRCFKHDFFNIIQAIDGYITMKNMPALEKYFSKLLKECDNAKNIELITAKSMNDPAIYGVLLNKYNLAKEKDIEMNVEIMVDFSDISDKSYLVSRVMGILLDNAIEAASECQKKKIEVRFLQENSEDRKIKNIIISNTYENKDVDTDIIFEKEFSSKKDKGNSGLGLWKVRDLIRKEEGMLLRTTKDEEMFRQQFQIVV